MSDITEKIEPENCIEISVEDILALNPGQNETFSFSEDLTIKGDDFTISGPVEITVTLMLLEEGIHAEITELTCEVKAICSRCCQEFGFEFTLKPCERIFCFSPQATDDLCDIFQVDKRTKSIDLYDFVRQEVILQLPSPLICSPECKGICLNCGKSLNKEQCSCKTEAAQISSENKPLGILKELFKN